MDNLEHKDNLNTATYGAIQESKILHGYLTDIERFVVKFEQDKSHESAVALAYEVTVLYERMSYLSDNILTKLLEIQNLNNEEDKTNAKNND